MVGPLLPWEIIAPFVLAIAAVFVIFKYIRTPAWMLMWFIVLGLSLYLLPAKIKVVGPAAIAAFIFIYKKSGEINR